MRRECTGSPGGASPTLSAAPRRLESTDTQQTHVGDVATPVFRRLPQTTRASAACAWPADRPTLTVVVDEKHGRSPRVRSAGGPRETWGMGASMIWRRRRRRTVTSGGGGGDEAGGGAREAGRGGCSARNVLRHVVIERCVATRWVKTRGHGVASEGKLACESWRAVAGWSPASMGRTGGEGGCGDKQPPRGDVGWGGAMGVSVRHCLTRPTDTPAAVW